MNKFNLILLIAFLGLVSCSKNKIEDPLILPPDFTLMPDLNNKKNQNAKEEAEANDVERIRGLLIQGN